MVLTSNPIIHIFNYPFEYVSKAFYNRYPDPESPDVLGVKILEKKEFLELNQVHYKREYSVKNSLPTFLKYLIQQEVLHIVEDTIINNDNKTLTISSKNTSFSSIVTCTEDSIYESIGENKTKFTQVGSVSGSAYFGPLLGSFERFVMDYVFKAGSQAPLKFEKQLQKTYGNSTNINNSKL